MSLDLYYKELEDILQSGEETNEILVLDDEYQAHPYLRDELTFTPENSRSGYAEGGDLTFTFLEGQNRRLYGMVSYTYGRVRTQDADGWLWEPWDRRHNVVTIGGVKIGRSWEIGWRWRFGAYCRSR